MGWLSFLSWRSARSLRLTRKTSGTLAAVERRGQVVVGAVGLDLDGGLVVGGVVGVDDRLVGVGLVLGAPDAEGQIDLGDRPGRRRAGGAGIVVVTGAPGDGGAQHEREGHHDPPALQHPSPPLGPGHPTHGPPTVGRSLRSRFTGRRGSVFASATTRSKTSRLTAAPSRRIASSSRMISRSRRTSLGRRSGSQAPAPMSIQCRPYLASSSASRSWSLLVSISPAQ